MKLASSQAQRRGWTHRLLTQIAAPLTYPLPPEDYLRPGADATQVRVEAIEVETAEAVTLTLRPRQPWPGHRAGQFVQLGVEVDGVLLWRCYSISSAPERADGCLTVTVKAVADGRVSRALCRDLSVGDSLRLGPVAGDFVLPAALPVRLLFVTAGSGITPVLSMLASLDARGAMPDVTVIHAAPSPDRMIAARRLQDLAARHPRLTVVTWYSGERGRLDPAGIEALCPDWRERETWACGPEALLETLERHWQRAGARLHVERFRPRPVSTSAVAEAATVDFVGSRRRVAGCSSQSLLDLAEDNGLAPAHGCRMGICHGCTATLKSGCVRDLRSGKTFSDEGDLVQICVCAPVGDVEIDL